MTAAGGVVLGAAPLADGNLRDAAFTMALAAGGFVPGVGTAINAVALGRDLLNFGKAIAACRR